MLTDQEKSQLEQVANRLRVTTIGMLAHAQAGHPGGSLSTAEILAALYFKVLRIDPARPDWEDRDRLVLSKGHAAPIYYAALAERGYFSEETLATYDEIDSILQGHPDIRTPGVDMSTGSLGQGLSAAIGMALGAKKLGKDLRVFAILGDGELEEGQAWEAIMSAPKFDLDNLVAIVDNNRLQLLDFVERIMPIEPLAEKWRAFNWNVLEVDGHDLGQIVAACEAAALAKGRPTVILAHTIKGKGVPFMEDQAVWHARVMTEAETEEALAGLAPKEAVSNA